MDLPKKIGRYEIIAELGHGAMGTVYRANDPAMDRTVALKTILSFTLAVDQAAEFRERFFREVRAAGGLAHPGIVPVFDVGEHEGRPFLVMEFIDGRTLADTVKQSGRLAIDRICEIGQRVAEALGYAHRHGVIHRDIKPANILMTSMATHGIERPKITDFGVAKLALAHTTSTGQMLGTPAFMPPEQFTGAPIDGRADLFSLGVVLYWLATGEQPFPGESVTAVSYKVVHTDPVPPRKLNPSIPGKLENIILKCLAKSPADRYQSGEELAQDLRELRSGGKEIPVSAQSAAEIDPDATLIEVPPKRGATHPNSAPVSLPPPQVLGQHPDTRAEIKNGKSGGIFAVAALVIILTVIAGLWFARRSKERAAISSSPPASPAIASTPTPASSLTEAPGVSGTPKEPPPAAAASSEPTPAKYPAKGSAAPTAQNHESSASPDFDPRTLDPKENARLKIDDKRMPQNIDYTVEMNGRPYFEKIANTTKMEDQNLFVPPGVQEFRVTATNGGVSKTSNTVSLEFRAKKKKTLRVELRTQGAPGNAGMPAALYPDTQIIITLK